MAVSGVRPFVSVKFSPVDRPQAFLLPEIVVDPPLAPGEEVIVETPGASPAIGSVVRTVPALASRRHPPEGSPNRVLRRATRDDIVARLRQQQSEKEAHRFCAMKIRERGLPMKLTKVERLFDGSQMVFHFTADGRVDFRELVRDLAARYRTRIEMRQIGVRDEAKTLGGYGSCGRPLCCTTWLASFEPVTIRMAKQQNLALNPSRLSGLCGRLKCCLRYELPNGKDVKGGGCASGGGCDNGGCGTSGGCGSGGCGTCGKH
jgi:cell fate regulator YaaT (PSP1 superfamily)